MTFFREVFILPLTCINYLHIEDNVKFRFGGGGGGGGGSNCAYLLALIYNVFILRFLHNFG